MLRRFLLFLFFHHVKPQKQPNADFVSELKNSPIEVFDYSNVGQTELNVQIKTTDPENICCASNYSVVWDDDGELLVFVADNFFCPKTLKMLKANALHPDRVWETLSQSINRVYRYGAKLGHTIYKGNFPGVTSYPVTHSSIMTLRRCFQPFINILLDSEQFILARQIYDQNKTEYPIYTPDVTNVHNLPTFAAIDPDDEREPSFYEEADGLPLYGNPITPKFESNFWASAAFPKENISMGHSQPHTDGTDIGLASVFTLADDPMYEDCATTFNKVSGTDLMITHNNDVLQTTAAQANYLQMDALRSGQSLDSGWLNNSQNRFSDVVAMVRNNYNRFIMYPSNRLHTAYVPGEKYLNADPHKGRLTMNTFWDVYSNNRAQCEWSVKSRLSDNDIKENTWVPRNPTEYLESCIECKRFAVFCGWCPYLHICLGDTHHRWQEINCPDVPVKGTNNGILGLKTSCQESTNVMKKCLNQDSCGKCRKVSGCAWCANKGLCTLEILGSCDNKLSHIGEMGSKKCPATATTLPAAEPTPKTFPSFIKQRRRTNYNCKAHTICHTCRDTLGCSWCLNGLPDAMSTIEGPNARSPVPSCVADTEDNCLTSNKDLVVGSYGTGICNKEVALDTAQLDIRKNMWKLPELLNTGKKEKEAVRHNKMAVEPEDQLEVEREDGVEEDVVAEGGELESEEQVVLTSDTINKVFFP